MTVIPIKPVKSSAIEGIGYEPSTQTLAIRFRGRTVTHHYRGVPPEKYRSLERATSIGNAFAQLVRDQHAFVIVHTADHQES